MHRKKAPIYIMGSADPVSFARGPEEEFPHIKAFLRQLERLGNRALDLCELLLSQFIQVREDKPADFDKVWQQTRYGKNYCSFSGVDVRLYAERQGKEPTLIAEAEAISVKQHLDDPIHRPFPVEGEIIFILFGRSAYQEYLQDSQNNNLNLVLKAATEHGIQAECRLDEVRFQESRFGVSIDDIVVEEVVVFKAKSCTGWQPITS